MAVIIPLSLGHTALYAHHSFVCHIRLAAWIRLNRPLTEALRQTGYYTKQRLFTSRQVALIFEYLGEP